jgi:hypothetical protein
MDKITDLILVVYLITHFLLLLRLINIFFMNKSIIYTRYLNYTGPFDENEDETLP